jgi:hypothetical protein
MTRTIPFVLLALAVSAAPAQEPPKPADPASAEAKPSGPSPEDLIAQRATPYKPTLSRDPFQSPTEIDNTRGGDLVDDISVKGIVKKDGKPLAVVSDSRGMVRWLPVGFKFRDGMIAAIDDKTVTFHQWDVNSSVQTAFRVVKKTFKREEAKK